MSDNPCVDHALTMSYPCVDHALTMSHPCVDHALTAQAGDVLLIPEGWWHQVASSAASIAVNLWWYSAAHAALSQPHMDAYFLRRCVNTAPQPAPIACTPNQQQQHSSIWCCWLTHAAPCTSLYAYTFPTQVCHNQPDPH